jgi:hypothetical protein
MTFNDLKKISSSNQVDLQVPDILKFLDEALSFIDVAVLHNKAMIKMKN